MTIERIGLGAGTQGFPGAAERAAALRRRQPSGPPTLGLRRDQVWVLETNLDDVPGEVIGYCFERLFAAGALDVFTTPIPMKKNRPGVLLSVLAEAEKLAVLEDILFKRRARSAFGGIRRSGTSFIENCATYAR